MVWDGGRRLRALKRLARSKRLPSDLQVGIPILVSDRQAARRRSLVTFVRENMHPAEEFRAYRALLDGGQDPDQIAASMGVDALRVAQLLRLRALAPEIIDAFQASAFGLDTAQAFTLSSDHDKQREALAACSDWINARRVRELLRAGTVSPNEGIARFVGRDAYQGAGGSILVDLFAQDRESEVWTDSGLVERLASEKRNALVAEVKAEGWDWVTVVEPYDYSWGMGFERLKGERVELSEADQAAYDAAAEVLEREDIEPEAYETAEATIADLDARMERGELTAERRAEAGAFIQIDGNGSVVVRRGYVKANRKAASFAGSLTPEDTAITGWGHTGHWHLTHIATAAVRHALLKDPAAAYDVLVASFAWRLAGGGGTPALKIEPRGIEPFHIPADAKLAGEAEWCERRAAWRERLPSGDFAKCFDAVVALSVDEKAEIVALAVGLGLDAVETRHDQRRPSAWAQLSAYAKRAAVDGHAVWRPDAAFLSKGSKGGARSGPFRNRRERCVPQVQEDRDGCRDDQTVRGRFVDA